MEVDDYFLIACKGASEWWLLARVQWKNPCDSNHVRCWVVNGAWEFELFNSSLLVSKSPFDPEPVFEDVVTYVLPKHIQFDDTSEVMAMYNNSVPPSSADKPRLGITLLHSWGWLCHQLYTPGTFINRVRGLFVGTHAIRIVEKTVLVDIDDEDDQIVF